MPNFGDDIEVDVQRARLFCALGNVHLTQPLDACSSDFTLTNVFESGLIVNGDMETIGSLVLGFIFSCYGSWVKWR